MIFQNFCAFTDKVKILGRKYHTGNWLSFLLVLVLALILFSPVYWMIRLSVTSREFLFELPPVPLRISVDISSYISVLQMTEFMRYYLNSIIIAAGTVLLALLAGVLAAYSFSRFRYYGRKTLMMLALTAQMFPWAMLLISLSIFFSRVHMLNTYAAIILTHTTFALPLTIWITKSYLDTIPKELEDSAFIDGCGRMKTLTSIILPLCRPGLTAAGIYVFIFSWNDFLFGLTLTSKRSMRPLAPGIVMEFLGERQTNWTMMSASAVIVTMPIVIAFLFLQRYFISGLTAGAVKE